MNREKLKSGLFNWQTALKSPNFVPVSIKLSLFLLIPIVAYFQDFVQVFSLALSDQEAQYVLLVPFIVAYFFYRRRKAFLVSRKNSNVLDFTGISLCLLALLIYILGSYSFYSLELHLLSLPIFIAALTLLIFGADTVKLLIFPIGLLFFLSPFPLFFMDAYGGNLMSSDGGLAALILKPFLPISITYQPIVVLTTLTTAGQQIQFSLNAACSGIYSLTAFLFCAVVFGYLASGSIVKKILYGLLAVVAAYFLNVFRIIFTVLLGHFYGIGLAVEFFHAVGGTVLAFVGTLFLLYFGSKVLKLSFMQKKAEVCSFCEDAKSKGSQFCSKCGRIFPSLKIKINWKRMAMILLFLVICADLIALASAVNYSVMSNQSAYNFNPTTGDLAALSNSTGWTPTFMGRETQAESQLGLIFVGDYYLTQTGGSNTINAIFEVSDLQSKFHTWEGCLNYQSYPINIQKITYVTIYDQNDSIVNGEIIVANAPTLNQTINIVYWFDSLNLETNGTVTNCAVKITLLRYTATSNDAATQAASVQAATSQLLALSQNYEQIWSQNKNTNNSFVIDLYRNRDGFEAVVIALLFLSALSLVAQRFMPQTWKSKKIENLDKMPEENADIEKKRLLNMGFSFLPDIDVVASSTVASQAVAAVIVSSAAKLAFIGVPSSLEVGVASGAISIQLQDAAGCPVNAGSPVTISMSPSGKWYLDSAGNIPLSSSAITIDSGSSSSPPFYFKSNVATTSPPSPTFSINDDSSSFYIKKKSSEPFSLSASSRTYTSALASLTVTPRRPQSTPPIAEKTVDHIVIMPDAASVSAGGSQIYSAEAFDEKEHSLGVIKAEYSCQGASVDGSSVSATFMGSYKVTGTYKGKSAAAALTVTHGAASNLTISPAGSSIKAGETTVYLATASDVYGNTWDVTSQTAWTISPEAGGSWNGNIYTSAKAGMWTIKGTCSNTSYTTDLTVNPANLDHFSIKTEGPQADGSAFNITVTALDAFKNTVTDYRGTPTLKASSGSISPASTGVFSDGVWSGSIVVTGGGSGVTIKAADEGHFGNSELFTINPALTASAGSHGSISPSGAVTANFGKDQTFTVAPDEHYHVADVLVDGISVGAVTSYTLSNIIESHTVKAIFAIDTKNISVSAGANGSITPSGSVSLKFGESQTFAITADAGYHIADVLMDGASVLNKVIEGKFTVSDVTEDAAITASFAVNTCKVAVDVGAHGSSNFNSQTVDWNSIADLVFTPDVGYHVADVFVNGDSVGPNGCLSLTVTQDTSVIVIFAINTYLITITQAANGLVTGPSTVHFGAEAAFTITPSAGYHIVDVLMNASSVLDKVVGDKLVVSDLTVDTTVSAVFAVNTCNVTVNVGVHGSSNQASKMVDWSSKLDFVFTPEAGFHVSDVLVNGASVSSDCYLSLTITEDTSVGVIFAIDTLPINVTQAANGEIAGPSTVDFDADGAFTIVPTQGYHVADVLIDGVSVGAVASHVISKIQSAHSITAVFEIDKFVITASAGAKGIITPNGSTSATYGSDQTFNITPDAHHHIVDVSVDGSSVGAVSTYTFTKISAEHSIIASFAVDTFNISASASLGGYISPNDFLDLEWGSSKTYTITPEPHHHIDDVLVDGSSVGAVDSYVFTEIAAAHTIEATFAIDTFPITASATAGGSISPSGFINVNYGSTQSFIVTANPGCHIVAIVVDSVSQGAVSSQTNVEADFANVHEPHMITAIFAVDTFNFLASAGVGGTISPKGKVSVNYGANQSFTITANAGYHIVEVIVDDASQGLVSPDTTSVQADFPDVHQPHKITATFAKN